MAVIPPDLVRRARLDSQDECSITGPRVLPRPPPSSAGKLSASSAAQGGREGGREGVVAAVGMGMYDTS